MRNVVINGTKFTTFQKGGETFLCTGDNVTGEIKLDHVGEICDYYSVIGATSVVSGTESIDELYAEWLIRTEFQRSVLNISF